jgi:hypothetical protein
MLILLMLIISVFMLDIHSQSLEMHYLSWERTKRPHLQLLTYYYFLKKGRSSAIHQEGKSTTINLATEYLTLFNIILSGDGT